VKGVRLLPGPGLMSSLQVDLHFVQIGTESTQPTLSTNNSSTYNRYTMRHLLYLPVVATFDRPEESQNTTSVEIQHAAKSSEF